MVMNSVKNKGIKRNDTPTPQSVVDFITELIRDLGYKRVLDPACGKVDNQQRGILTSKLQGIEVIQYDIIYDTNFLDETEKIDADLVIVNPPFNRTDYCGKGRMLLPEQFMDKIIKLCGKDIPIILITPMGFRLNCGKTSKRRKKLMNDYPDITSIISLPVDVFEGVKFHTEILCFNIPQLKPHYVYPY
tara:strand:- start:280 stop:846 length:567 start_codon:yes stop_codon:yes gene_type:complete